MRYLLLCLSLVTLSIAGCGEITWFPNNYGNIPTQNDVVFTSQTGVKVLTQVQSNSLTVTGLTNSVAISVSNGEYSIDGGAFTAAAGTIGNNQRVVVRHTSALSFNTTVGTTLTVGAKSGTFFSTTGADPNFTIPQKSGTKSTLVTSDPLTINAAQASVSFSITNGEYAIGSNGAFTSNTQTFNNTTINGQPLTVRNTAAATSGLTETTTLTIVNGTMTLTGTYVTTAQ